MELKRLREELSSEAFKNLYRELRDKHEMLSPFPTVFDLIEFFHSDSRDYAVKDSILGFLVAEYRKGGPFHRLGAFLFTPGIVRVYSIARKRALVLDPAEALNQTCLSFTGPKTEKRRMSLTPWNGPALLNIAMLIVR